MKANFSLSMVLVSVLAILSSCSGVWITFLWSEQDGVSYELASDADEATAVGYYVRNGKLGKNIVLPPELEANDKTYKVVAVKDSAFIDGPWEKVVFGSNIRSIGRAAFGNCESIRSVRIDGSVLPELSESAFEDNVYEEATLYINPGVDVSGSAWARFSTVIEF
ncbi:MAG: leucine-rich repeat domain-containing protein [Allobaculum sp.]|nr:leucine-rich repeat domain-containing protein [Allobaculum sp.]